MAINPTPLIPKPKKKANPMLLMIGAAMFLGLSAAFGIFSYLNKTQQEVKELSVTRAIVVAARPIMAGAKIVPDDLTTKQVSTNLVPQDYPSSPDAIKDRITKSTIAADEVITEDKLIVKGSKGGLPGLIPEGQRAVTIKVNDVIGVGGFVTPGDRVDIVAVRKDNKSIYSKTILQNILVVAIGDKLVDPNNVTQETGAMVVAQLTFALSPDEAEKLILASATNQIQLILRPSGDQTEIITIGTTTEDVFGLSPVTELPGFNKDKPKYVEQIEVSSNNKNSGPKNVIDIILGNERTYEYY